MFEIGKKYTFVMDHGLGSETSSAKVVGLAMPLIWIDNGHIITAVNTSSRAFVSAQDESSRREVVIEDLTRG